MPIQRYKTEFKTLGTSALAQWKDLPPAVVSDCMNRTQVMAGAIKPVENGMRVLGQARTVTCMVGDNSAVSCQGRRTLRHQSLTSNNPTPRSGARGILSPLLRQGVETVERNTVGNRRVVARAERCIETLRA